MKLFRSIVRTTFSPVRTFSTKNQIQAAVTIEVRDWVQSSMKGWLGMKAALLEYFRTINSLHYSGEQSPIKSLMAFGGTWFQLPAMHNDNPFDVWRKVIAATPAKAGRKALAIELLQRSSHLFGLEEVSQDVIRETYRKLAEISGPEREIIIRLFHFNNRDMHKLSTYAAIAELRAEGINNYVISDEHSYAVFMKNEDVAEGIVRGLLRNIQMTSGDICYPIQGGIKDFSGSLAPDDSDEILRITDSRIKEEADKLAREGNTVDAERLNKATITLHSHLTDRSEKTADRFEQVGRELNRIVTTHRIHNVENATHHIINTEGISGEQLDLHKQGENLLAKIVKENDKLVVKDYEPGKPRRWTGFAGGGTPMIQLYIDVIAGMFRLDPPEAEAQLYRHMERIRDRNKIPTVTPAQKSTADLGLLGITNEYCGTPLYAGEYTPEAIDVIRNLHPEDVKDKDMLEGGYRQYQEKVLSSYVKDETISSEFKTAIQEIGMNNDRSSFDKDKIKEVIATFAAKGEKLHPLIEDEIIEASGPATRPTRFPDQIANARKLVEELKEKNALKIPEDEAVLLVASLHGRDIGITLAEHHGDKTKFPALQQGQQSQEPVYSVNTAQLWKSNVAGCVLKEVVHGCGDDDEDKLSFRR